jgi:dihydrofolate reductase
MGTIRVHEFITLDGAIEAPSWTFDFAFDPRMGTAIGRLQGGCEAILLGRTTYAMFEPAWSPRTAADDPGAPFMNETPKYIVSASLGEPSWRNSEVIGPYDADGIRRLKERTSGGIYVSGSGMLVRGLLADDLVDELHLFVFPLVLGAGARLFADGVGPSRWTLAGEEAYESGVVYLSYRRASAVPPPA